MNKKLIITLILALGVQLLVAQKIPKGYVLMSDGFSEGKFTYDIDLDGKKI